METERVTIKGKDYFVQYVPKEKLCPAFGCAWTSRSMALVRNDLPKPIRVFVREHELYHLRDSRHWGGWVGRELRANFFAGLRHPLGFLLTILATLMSWRRVFFYLTRLKEGR